MASAPDRPPELLGSFGECIGRGPRHWPDQFAIESLLRLCRHDFSQLVQLVAGVADPEPPGHRPGQCQRHCSRSGRNEEKIPAAPRRSPSGIFRNAATGSGPEIAVVTAKQLIASIAGEANRDVLAGQLQTRAVGICEESANGSSYMSAKRGMMARA